MNGITAFLCLYNLLIVSFDIFSALGIKFIIKSDVTFGKSSNFSRAGSMSVTYTLSASDNTLANSL